MDYLDEKLSKEFSEYLKNPDPDTRKSGKASKPKSQGPLKTTKSGMMDRLEKGQKESGTNPHRWQRAKDSEAAKPYTEKEKKLYPKGSKALKDLGHKPKQRAGKEAHKLKGMSKTLKQSHGSPSQAAKDPKVKKKVDRIYNKMLDTNKSPQVEEGVDPLKYHLALDADSQFYQGMRRAKTKWDATHQLPPAKKKDGKMKKESVITRYRKILESYNEKL